jgi:hypothetical protein
VTIKLKSAWRDGTTHLVFEPLEFLAKLAALTPRPAINLLLYHGVLAPHARWHGTIMNGHHRIQILQERGYPVNTLPRVPYP